MPYADTDFFLALIKERDWLQSSAGKLYKKYRGQLWTSITTIIEVLLLAARLKLDPERLVLNLSRIAQLRGVDLQVALLAAHFMKQDGLGTFDALHGAFCFAERDEIISSDKVFDRIGLTRIPLED